MEESQSRGPRDLQHRPSPSPQHLTPSPKAQLSTRAPRALPLCQLVALKLVMGSCGSLFLIQPSSLVGGSASGLPAPPSSSHMGMEMEQQDQGPDEAQDQLEVPRLNGLAVCKGNEWQRWVGTG